MLNLSPNNKNFLTKTKSISLKKMKIN